MIASAQTLVAAVEAAQADLAETVDAIVALRAEMKTLAREEEAHQREYDRQSEVQRRVDDVLRRLLNGTAMQAVSAKAVSAKAVAAEPEAAVERRSRIEQIAAELGVLELREEALLRALERPGVFLLPRREDVDPALVVAPHCEIEEALAEAQSELDRLRASRSRKARAA
jgi:hypothetical protein